jgi:hypothetical protein
MAENLLWLADEAYPGRRIIVWAHNAHISRGVSRVDARAFGYDETSVIMGELVAQALGDRVYALGFAAYEGQTKPPWEDGPQAIPPAPPGSLEERLHATGLEQAIIDFRDLPPAGAWLREPHALRGFTYGEPTVGDWTTVFDGVLFIDTMTPSTHRRRAPTSTHSARSRLIRGDTFVGGATSRPSARFAGLVPPAGRRPTGVGSGHRATHRVAPTSETSLTPR